jgi:hypothetical protein
MAQLKIKMANYLTARFHRLNNSLVTVINQARLLLRKVNGIKLQPNGKNRSAILKRLIRKIFLASNLLRVKIT